MTRLSVYHFHNGHEGGVFNVIKNLLLFTQDTEIENHLIQTINKDITPKHPLVKVRGAVTHQVFYYSPRWNFYYTCRQLAKLLPGDKALIVAHDWLELGMASNLGLQNPVVQIVHGNYDYYYDLARKHEAVVDAYICISNKIFSSLQAKLSSGKADIFYLNFPVPEIKAVRKVNDVLHLIYYAGNLKDVNKQFVTIVEIARELSSTPADYFFTIAGGGMTAQQFFETWPVAMKERVNFKGLQTNQEIISLLGDQDIFLLPSLNEGLPVSLVEAMKAGVVPLITNWAGSADELLTDAVTGYYFKTGAAFDYANCIRNLLHNRQLLNQLSSNSILKANTLFNATANTKRFEDLFKKVAAKKAVIKKPIKIYGSRLDHPLIPNFITSSIRSKK